MNTINNQAFSKIWIIVILAALISGGALLWNYSKIQNNDNEINEIDKNPVVEYFKNVELQCEESQKENISIALNDILNLSEEELKEKKYKDYTGKENQWDLPTLIDRHFVPDGHKLLGDNFYHDVKSVEAQNQIKIILDKYFGQNEKIFKDETADWETYRNEKYGYEIKYPGSWKAPYYKIGWSAGTSFDTNNYCIVDVSRGSINSKKDEIADLIKKGYSKTSLTIDGINGIRLTKSQAGLTEAVYFSFNNADFRIARNKGFEDMIEDECINVFNQMLSTFKFLE